MPDIAATLPAYQLPTPSRSTAPKKRAAKKAKKTTPSPPPAIGPKKLSGHQYTKARKVRTAAEQARHAARLAAAGQVALTVDPCRDPLQAHLYEIQRILDLQHLILTDPNIPNEDKARHLTAFAQAMAKLRTDAELERKIEALEKERAVESEKLEAEVRRVKIEARRIEADRAELDAAWAKLHQERARIAAEQRAAGLPVIQALS